MTGPLASAMDRLLPSVRHATTADLGDLIWTATTATLSHMLRPRSRPKSGFWDTPPLYS